jgi:tetrahydromethanopterin S-methyltransferase subunit G
VTAFAQAPGGNFKEKRMNKKIVAIDGWDIVFILYGVLIGVLLALALQYLGVI